eukprot:6184288-Pleurochrysis_carterae.AAC.1
MELYKKEGREGLAELTVPELKTFCKRNSLAVGGKKVHCYLGMRNPHNRVNQHQSLRIIDDLVTRIECELLKCDAEGGPRLEPDEKVEY